jgi:hypothetical protein
VFRVRSIAANILSDSKTSLQINMIPSDCAADAGSVALNGRT